MRGKVIIRRNLQYTKRDHPRLCGEKVIPLVLINIFLGSPPPMRGKGAFCIQYTTHRVECQAKDHPRLCGEKYDFPIHFRDVIGSPPPMRGKAEAFPVADFFVGITPAYAGKSEVLPLSDHIQKDHPRLCGEKQTGLLRLFHGTGSPPPMRGKVQQNRKTA